MRHLFFISYRSLKQEASDCAGERFIEVSHEALLREWRPAAIWRTAANARLELQREVTDATRAYQAGRGDTWAGDRRLREATALLREDPFRFSRPETSFIHASMMRRRLVWTLVSFILAITGLTAVGSILAVQRGREVMARRQLLQAQALSNQADRLPDSLLIAARSLKQHPVPEARGFLAANLGKIPRLIGEDDHAAAPTAVNDLRASSDGKFLISAGNDKNAQIWKVAPETGLIRWATLPHEGNVRQAIISAGGRVVVTLSGFNTVTLWRYNGRFEPQILTSGSVLAGEVAGIALSPKGDFVAVADGYADSTHAVRLYPVNTAGTVHELALKGAVSRVQFSSDGGRLLTAPMYPGPVLLWTAWETAHPISHTLGTGAIIALGDANLENIFSRGTEGTRVWLWQKSPNPRSRADSTGQPPGFYTSSVVQAATVGNVTVDGRGPQRTPFVALAGSSPTSPTIDLWDGHRQTFGNGIRLTSFVPRIYTAPDPLSPNHTLLFAASMEGAVRVFRMEFEDLRIQSREIAILPQSGVTDACSIPGTPFVASVALGRVRLWSLKTLLRPAQCPPDVAGPQRIVALRAGELLLTRQGENSFRWNLSVNKMTRLTPDVSRATQVWSADGEWNAAFGKDALICRRTLKTAKQIALPLPQDLELKTGATTTSIVFSPDSQFVGCLMRRKPQANTDMEQISPETVVCLWQLDLNTGTVAQVKPQQLIIPAEVSELWTNSDATLLFTKALDLDSPLLIWRVKGNEVQASGMISVTAKVGDTISSESVDRNDNWIATWRVSPDSKRLLVGDAFGELKLFRVNKEGCQEENSTLFGSRITTLAFAPRSDRIAVATMDSRIHLLDLPSLLETMTIPDGLSVFQMSFDSQGRYLAVLEAIRPFRTVWSTARIYPVSDSDLLTETSRLIQLVTPHGPYISL